MSATKYIRGGCKCCCKTGDIIARLENVTKVRPKGDSGGTHYTATPYPRYDTAIYNTDNPDAGCNTLPAGSCGTWLEGGDLNGVSVHVIEEMVNDIMSCDGAIDHNCYSDNGDTVDMRSDRFGGQWILAKKNWHGCFGFTSPEACSSPNPNIPPDQVKYCSLSVDIHWSSYGANFEGQEIDTQSAFAIGTINVDKHSGIITKSYNSEEHDTTQLSPDDPVVNVLDIANGAGTVRNLDGSIFKTYLSGYELEVDRIAGNCDFHCDNQIQNYGGGSLADFIATWNESTGSFPELGIEITAFPDITDPNSYSGTASQTNEGQATDTYSISWSKTATSYTWSVTRDRVPAPDANPFEVHTDFHGSVSLGNPYTASECYNDFKAALNAWDMSDFNLASLRSDEQLANAPLCIYDELGPTSPITGFFPTTMDDLSGSLINDANGNAPGSDDYVTTWPQRAWLDDRNFIWRYPGAPDGTFTTPDDFTGGATLITPLYSGNIISHTPAGSDRHFWFGARTMQRQATPGGTNPFEWFDYTHGAFSSDPLPSTAMRWMDKSEAQYDGLGRSTEPGNWPMAFLHQKNGVLKGAKFCVATMPFKSYNKGRPCGADKYAVDQPTVCCITGGDATSGFTIKKTGNATAPLASAGLAANDYVAIESDGIYKISSIADNGTSDWDSNGDPYQRFTISVGTKIDDLPTGFSFQQYGSESSDGFNHIGRLRFPTASGICGRAEISTSYDADTGLLTITTASLPWLRKNPIAGTILVDIYDADMTLLAASVSLTRVDDGTFTVTHAAMPTAAYMTGMGVDWTLYSSASKKTGVHIEWQFNPRAADGAYTSPPDWYADTPGCTGATISTFNYSSGKCPAIIGIVPMTQSGPSGDDRPAGDDYPPSATAAEDFDNQVLFPFPDSFVFDDIFGGHWQAGIFLTMSDPFWQVPFKPDGDIVAPDILNWREDNGSGQEDDDSITEGGAEVFTKYFARSPLVEATTDSSGLPSGIYSFYDPDHNEIGPPYYPNGIPIGDDAGNYGSVETDWGFYSRICANIASSGRFADFYQIFMFCP